MDSETDPNMDPETKAELDSGTKESIDPENKLEIDPETKPILDTDTKADIDSGTKEGIDPEIKPNEDSETKLNKDSETKPNMDPENKTGIDSETQPKPVVELKPKPITPNPVLAPSPEDDIESKLKTMSAKEKDLDTIIDKLKELHSRLLFSNIDLQRALSDLVRDCYMVDAYIKPRLLRTFEKRAAIGNDTVELEEQLGLASYEIVDEEPEDDVDIDEVNDLEVAEVEDAHVEDVQEREYETEVEEHQGRFFILKPPDDPELDDVYEMCMQYLKKKEGQKLKQKRDRRYLASENESDHPSTEDENRTYPKNGENEGDVKNETKDATHESQRENPVQTLRNNHQVTSNMNERIKSHQLSSKFQDTSNVAKSQNESHQNEIHQVSKLSSKSYETKHQAQVISTSQPFLIEMDEMSKFEELVNCPQDDCILLKDIRAIFNHVKNNGLKEKKTRLERRKAFLEAAILDDLYEEAVLDKKIDEQRETILELLNKHATMNTCKEISPINSFYCEENEAEDKLENLDERITEQKELIANLTRERDEILDYRSRAQETLDQCGQLIEQAISDVCDLPTEGTVLTLVPKLVLLLRSIMVPAKDPVEQLNILMEQTTRTGMTIGADVADAIYDYLKETNYLKKSKYLRESKYSEESNYLKESIGADVTEAIYNKIT